MENKDIYKVNETLTGEDIHPQAPVDKVKDSLRRDLIPKTADNRSVTKEMSDKLKSFTTDNIFAGGTPGDSPNE